MNFKRLLLFLAAPLALVMSSCEPDGPVYTTPSIAITDAEGAEVSAVNFSAEEGEVTITITATRGWSISKQATWLGVAPSSHTNDTMEEQSVDVKISVGPNDGDPRSETLKVVMDKIEKSIAVHQADQEGNTTGGTGEGTLESPYDVARAMNIILEGTYTEDMVYTEGIISELGEDGRAQFGNYTFSISDDGTTAGQLLVYRCKYFNGKNFTTSDNLAVGDKVIICGQLVNFKGNTPEIQSCYIAAHNGEMPDAPVLKEGVYASDAAFVCNIDNSNNAVYSLGDTNVGGNDVSGFKLGTGSKAGVFTSQAIGVSGDKYLNFYAVAWNGKTATLYYRVNGGEAMSQALVANAGANNNAPYNGLVVAATDHYSVKLTGLQATDKIEFSTNSSFSAAADDASGRAIVFGVKLTDEALEGEAGSGSGDSGSGDSGDSGDTTAPENALLWASFATSMDNFTTENVELGGLDHVWFHDTDYKQMKASAYVDNTRYATESYLVSPVVALTGAEDYYMNFDHTGKFFSNMSEQATLWVREEGGAWAQLTIPTYMTGNDWTFVNSGDIALTAYAGKNIQIGFRYTSTTTDAPTWEVKNVLVAKGTASETPDTPDTPDTPNVPLESIDATSDAAFVCTSDDSTNAAYGLGESKVNGVSATGFKLGKGKQEGKFTSTAVGVSGDKYLNFFAVSWGAGGDKTIYFRVNGGEVKSQAIRANDGAKGNAPYTMTVYANDHYSVLLSGLNENDVIEFGTNADFALTGGYAGSGDDYAPRVIFFGVKLTDEPLTGEGSGDQGGEEPEPEDPEQPEDPEEPTTVTLDEITEYGTYNITGATVVAVEYSNMVVKGTEKMFNVKKLASASANYNVGDVLSLTNATVKDAYGVTVIDGEATDLVIEKTGTVTVEHGEATAIDAAWVTSFTESLVPEYVTVSGVGAASGSAYSLNIAVEGSDINMSVTLPTKDEVTALVGKNVTATGYAFDYNSKNKYVSIMKVDLTVVEGGETPEEPEDPEIPANTIALPWLESFDSEDLSKYTIVNGGSATKVYLDGNLAGGELGEILIGKQTGSMTANIASDGSAQTLNLWFKSNYADRVTVTSATTGVTLTKVTNTGYTVEVAAGVEVFALTLSNTNSSNVRVDDIVLTAEEPTIESISVSGAQVLFTEGDDFATGDDFTVTAILQNGATKDVTANVTVDSSAVDMTTAGTYTVTVSYDNISTTYNVTVQAAGVEIVTTSFVFKEMGYSNAEDVASVTQNGVTIDFALGTNTSNNSAKYYNTGEGVRTYVGNTITVSCDGNISAIDFKFAGDSYNKISADGYSGTTWSGSAKEVVFDSTGTTRIQSITVTYAK